MQLTLVRRLVFVTTLALAPIAHGASKQVIVESHKTSLRVVELEKMAPPYAAFMWALANDAAFASLKGSQHPELSYQAAFTRAVALIKPKQASVAEAWLAKRIAVTALTSSEAATIRDAQDIAQKFFDKVSGELARAEQPATTLVPATLGVWRPTPPAHANPALPNWDKLTLFSQAPVSTLTQGLWAPAVGSAKYQKDLDEVYRLGGVNSSERTADQTEIAKFWVGGAGTVTPPGLWIDIALQRLVEVPFNFTESVSVMRTLSFALCDAGIAAWKTKYEQQLWRPITAVQEELNDKNWSPLIPTPPFPSYVSGHSTFSGAAASVLAVILPLENEPLRITSPDLPGVVRSYKSYREAANEAGLSRIYGGGIL